MPKVTIYHNPHCSKSRQTLDLLRQKGIEPTIVEYLKTPPNVDTLKKVLELLGLPPSGLMRKKEPAYKEAGLDDESLSEDAQIAAMVAHPKVIERPIVVSNGKARIGRPPESVLDIV
ncbi:MAG: arsenate reductase (glutaredoxin) [Acidiferrobacterales bacterium]